MVVGQLVERSLLTTEIHGSDLAMDNFYLLSDQNKLKEVGNVALGKVDLKIWHFWNSVEGW